MNGVLLPLAAIAAGTVSATSPCVLPVLPGYLAAVSAPDSRDTDGHLRPSVVGALGFVAGFTLVFTLLGATASALGGLLFSRLDIALNIAGVLLIVLGLQATGALRFMSLTRERRLVGLEQLGRGRRRSIVLGAVFALGWTPCVGPILATILTKAAADASLTEGLMLLLLYSAGLGLPFIALAIWFDRSERVRRWLGRRSRVLQQIGGFAMIAIGLAYISGVWSTMFAGIQGILARTGWPPI